MTPPEAPIVGKDASTGDMPPAVSLRLEVLRKRPDFQRAARAAHVAKPGFVVQMRERRSDEVPGQDVIRVGFTCSKKVGNAVARNRAKRRLREIARLALPTEGRGGMDYVLIGRKDKTADLPFAQLRDDFSDALKTLHARAK
ncbi:MAG: ribonuclease P protein component [Sulfitobacter sp.]|nr:ribonuclease P protein component [Sulfitobacter sp.]